MNRTCSKCGVLKALEDFVVDNRKVAGRSHVCKECRES